MFDNASCSLISTFERELGDAAQEFTPHLLKWIDEIKVIRVLLIRNYWISSTTDIRLEPKRPKAAVVTILLLET